MRTSEAIPQECDHGPKWVPKEGPIGEDEAGDHEDEEDDGGEAGAPHPPEREDAIAVLAGMQERRYLIWRGHRTGHRTVFE